MHGGKGLQVGGARHGPPPAGPGREKPAGSGPRVSQALLRRAGRVSYAKPLKHAPHALLCRSAGLLRRRHTALSDTLAGHAPRAAGGRAQMSAILCSAATMKGTTPGHACATALPSAHPSTRTQTTPCTHAGSGCRAQSGVAWQHGAQCAGLARVVSGGAADHPAREEH